MAPNDVPPNLRRKRSTLRSTVTRLIPNVKEEPQCNNMDYQLECLEEKTKELSKSDEKIHYLLPDDEYGQNVVEYEKYEDYAKLTIFLA
ncbi:hypothetical protein TNCT_710691 [Trichonephila clavata]|uniref:Uncharacterized protein n=1 Tax=Trichonephila clavata TaxID=2740835 RepID=A0A8X6KGB9_TRICU|nr:hypothetical protein TNCT_710691 [Trichonephila clavata]